VPAGVALDLEEQEAECEYCCYYYYYYYYPLLSLAIPCHSILPSVWGLGSTPGQRRRDTTPGGPSPAAAEPFILFTSRPRALWRLSTFVLRGVSTQIAL